MPEYLGARGLDENPSILSVGNSGSGIGSLSSCTMPSSTCMHA